MTRDINSPITMLSADSVARISFSWPMAYAGYSGMVTMDEVDIAKIKYTLPRKPVVQEVFLELMILGKNISLYRYKDQVKTRYFFSSDSTEMPAELIYRAVRKSASVFTFFEDIKIKYSTLRKRKIRLFSKS
jgi:hypothetical protein